MKRSSKILLGTALTIGLVGGVAAYAKHHFGDPERFAQHMVEHVSDELDLNDTQAQSLRSLADELVELKTLMRENMSADGQAIRDMLVADSFDRARAIDMIDAKTTAIQDNAPTIVAALGTFLDGLTQEQKAEIAQRMDHHGNHHRGQRWLLHRSAARNHDRLRRNFSA